MLRFAISLLSMARAGQKAGAERKSHIWFIGVMPPPLNGQSNYDRRLTEFFADRSSVTVLPTGGSGGEKILAALLLPLIVLLFISRSNHVYTSPPGQKGLGLFLLTIAALRLRKHDHFVHHHSFRPINLAPHRLSRLLAKVGGPFQRHVFLSEVMMERYAALYLSEEQRRRSFVLPNAYFFFEEQPSLPDRSGQIVIGHLSVITREKGVGYLMSLIRGLSKRRTDFRFVLAGPIRDAELEAEVKTFCQSNASWVSYLGPVTGEAKAAFYREIDLFVLPSRLVDEADPLVILEAFSYGCDIVASATGCIPERISRPDRLLSFDQPSDVDLLDRALSDVAADRHATAETCIAHVKAMHERSKQQARDLFAALDIELPH